MNRRALLKGMVAVTAAGILLPATLEENAEAARRYWALGQMPQVWDAHVHDLWTAADPWIDIYLYQPHLNKSLTLRVDALSNARDLLLHVPDDIRSIGGRPTAIAWRPGNGLAPWVQDLTGVAPGRVRGVR